MDTARFAKLILCVNERTSHAAATLAKTLA
jgi:hypothetical protein